MKEGDLVSQQFKSNGNFANSGLTIELKSTGMHVYLQIEFMFLPLDHNFLALLVR